MRYQDDPNHDPCARKLEAYRLDLARIRIEALADLLARDDIEVLACGEELVVRDIHE